MDVTYAPVGGTRTGELPTGYDHLRYRTRLPPGAFVTAAEAVLTWRMHRAAGVGLRASAPRAAPGVRVAVGFGVGALRLWAPCVVVWTVEEADRAGWGYGTLPGHPQSGEEAFMVTRDAGGGVWLTVLAYSRPARWVTRAGGPLVGAFQRGYARWLGRTLVRLCRRPDG